ncbi:hypothetical protein [Campylobacter sp. MG1]|uniref:hypothetical protein n=1 Tax=Campylobacter sp. MG1 TaxID=2976332 RepID=UPI00226CF498|nr:hypothetical protein [Campylobacter sp. MG1]
MNKKSNNAKALASKLNNSIKQTIILLIISLTLLFPYLAFANDIIIDNNASKSNQPQITPATKQTILSLITAIV